MLVAHSAQAQNWPNRPLHMRVGWAPGGTTDILARIIAQKLQETYGVAVLVENRPGAAGGVDAAAFANSALDDHTLMMVPPGVQSINQFLYKSLGYDPENDFVSVCLVAQIPNALAIHASTQLFSFKEFIDYAKANPNKMNYASAGIGTTGHLLNELLKTRVGIDVTHVPYKGNGPALQALLAREVDFNTDGNAGLLQQIRAGKLRALAVSSDKRWVQLPDVPTFAELGYPELTMQVWYGLVAQAKMPKAIIARVNRDVNAILARPEMVARLRELNLEALPGSPEDMAALAQRERVRWKKVVEASGARAD
jgi:tripartite-type tricarboxylate transporter receptor subunit TctC